MMGRAVAPGHVQSSPTSAGAPRQAGTSHLGWLPASSVAALPRRRGSRRPRQAPRCAGDVRQTTAIADLTLLLLLLLLLLPSLLCVCVQILAEIGELRRDVDEQLLAAQSALDGDARVDAEMRAKHGDKWRAQAAASAGKPYWDRVSQYRWAGARDPVVASLHHKSQFIRRCLCLLLRVHAAHAIMHTSSCGLQHGQSSLAHDTTEWALSACWRARHFTCRTSMQKAGDSDQGVLRRLSDNEGAFAKLSMDSAAAAMPRFQVCYVLLHVAGTCSPCSRKLAWGARSCSRCMHAGVWLQWPMVYGQRASLPSGRASYSSQLGSAYSCPWRANGCMPLAAACLLCACAGSYGGDRSRRPRCCSGHPPPQLGCAAGQKRVLLHVAEANGPCCCLCR